MSRILLGVSGGIAAYKALEFVRLATAAGHAVRVVQTPASLRFVGRASFEALTGAPVLVGEFDRDPARGAFPGQELPSHEPIGHLALVENADLYLIAPASANTLAKLAAGLADNMLSSAALAARCPLVLAPAMNSRMYEHSATAANLRTLRERGATIVEPDAGRLASVGEHGVGRLPEPERLLEVCEALLGAANAQPPAPSSANPADGEALERGRSAQARAQRGREDPHDVDPPPAKPARSPLSGLRVLVTAGGTREPIDAVRYVGNRSSGRMGFALAAAAVERGAEVVLIAANVALREPDGVRRVEVSTARELLTACEREFADCDVLLMAAAVADFAPAGPAEGKIKRAGREHLRLELQPTPDVLASLVARRRAGQTLVGFAAEHGDGALTEARSKLERKHLDALVLNDISRADIGFDSPENEVTLLVSSRNGSAPEAVALPRADKLEVARAILDAVEHLRESS